MISLGRPRNGVLRSQVPRLWADSRQPFPYADYGRIARDTPKFAVPVLSVMAVLNNWQDSIERSLLAEYL